MTMTQSEAERRLAEIVALAMRYDHPGVQPDLHAFASKVLQLAGVKGESR